MAAVALLAGGACHARTACDVVLRNGRIVDGTGAPWYRGGVGVRALAVGLEDRQASPEQMERTKALVREAMEAGAIGLSTALIYPPAVFAGEAEITELAKVAGIESVEFAPHNGKSIGEIARAARRA
jgi:N-acyl-D-aspartate/D-glutamate deacylase